MCQTRATNKRTALRVELAASNASCQSMTFFLVLIKEPGDETHPVCRACSKKNRPCQWETPHTKFKDYQPESSSTKSTVDGDEDESRDDETVDGVMDVDETDRVEGSEGSQSRRNSPRRINIRAGASSEAPSATVSSPSAQHSPGSSFYVGGPRTSRDDVSVGSLLRSHVPESIPQGTRPYSKDPVPLTHEEARLVHHYTEHLGRWLDCTDATRQFTLGVPEKVKECPVLCHAVLSFAARHRRNAATANAAYQRCIALLIDRLNEDAAGHDETLLCAIVILRFYEQLNGNLFFVYVRAQV